MFCFHSFTNFWLRHVVLFCLHNKLSSIKLNRVISPSSPTAYWSLAISDFLVTHLKYARDTSVSQHTVYRPLLYRSKVLLSRTVLYNFLQNFFIFLNFRFYINLSTHHMALNDLNDFVFYWKMSHFLCLLLIHFYVLYQSRKAGSHFDLPFQTYPLKST